MPPRKLHHLLYLSQALYAAENAGQKLVPATFLAAEAGPLEPNIYQLFADGAPVIQPAPFNLEIEAFLHEMWERFGQKPMGEIATFVERDGVWSRVLDASRNAEIPIEAMVASYVGSRALGSTPERQQRERQRKPQKEYWTDDGKRATKWTPGVSGGAPTAVKKEQIVRGTGGGIKRIIEAGAASAPGSGGPTTPGPRKAARTAAKKKPAAKPRAPRQPKPKA